MAFIQIVLAGGLALGGALEFPRATGRAEATAEGKAVSLTCSLANIMAEVSTRAMADRALMEVANIYKFRNRGRAARHLTRYLQGVGGEESFPLADLLLEDESVRRVVVRTMNQPFTPRERGIIVIRQRDYRINDWWGALGSFTVYFSEIGTMKVLGRDTKVALAYGVNEYIWHPNDSRRLTQCVHQAAERLAHHTDNRVPVAKAFHIYATPTHIDMATGMPIQLLLDSRAEAQMRVSMSTFSHRPVTYIGRDE